MKLGTFVYKLGIFGHRSRQFIVSGYQVEGQDKVVNMGWDEELNIGQDRELDNNENENK